MPDRQPMSCYLYVIESQSEQKPVKIGIANDAKKRLAGLQTGNPYPLTIKIQQEFKTREYALKAEKEIHERCARYRLEGEWFHARAVSVVQSYLRNTSLTLRDRKGQAFFMHNGRRMYYGRKTPRRKNVSSDNTLRRPPARGQEGKDYFLYNGVPMYYQRKKLSENE